MPRFEDEIGGTYITIVTNTNYEVTYQTTVPICAPPAPECTLEITGTTITNVSVRGETDGSILAVVSGATGSTITWYLNGVPQSGTGLSNNFTGLTAGFYNILADEGVCESQVTNLQVIDGEFRTGNFTVNSPTGLAATENPIIISIQTAQNTGTPAYGASNFNVTDTINDGDKITIALEYPQSYTAVFTAKYFPTRDDYFLASVVKDGQGNVVANANATEIATSIAECISKDVVLNRLYWIRTSGAIVYLTAKEQNQKLNLNTSTVTISGNISLTETTIGNSSFDGQMTESYSLYCDIFVNTEAQYGTAPTITDNFNKVAQIELPFQSNNKHQFDVSPILKNFVSTPKINFGVSGYTTLADNMASYIIQYGEKYPLVPNSTTKKSRAKGVLPSQFCINAALDWEENNDMDDYLGQNATNLNPNWNYTFFTYMTAYGVNFVNSLFSTGDTGTTNVMYSIWNSVDDTIVSAWQTGSTFGTGGVGALSAGGYYGHISGITNGNVFEYRRSFYVTPYAGGQDTATYPVAKSNVLFLTNSPSPKLCQRNSSEFLYVILPKDYGYALTVKGDLYFYDGSVLTGQTLYNITTGSTNYGGVFGLAAGYNELNLESYEILTGGSTRKIRRVDFAIWQSDVLNDFQLTETKSFRYEIDEQPRRYGVAFLSKSGVWDIFDFSGEIVDDVDFKNEKMEVPRAVGDSGNSPLGFQVNTVYDTKVTKKVAANSGWIDEAHFDWLMELLTSNRIYNYTEDYQPFLTVESVNYKKSSNDDLYNIDVNFIETINQNGISV